jgi:hypothetical protein
MTNESMPLMLIAIVNTCLNPENIRWLTPTLHLFHSPIQLNFMNSDFESIQTSHHSVGSADHRMGHQSPGSPSTPSINRTVHNQAGPYMVLARCETETELSKRCCGVGQSAHHREALEREDMDCVHTGPGIWHYDRPYRYSVRALDCRADLHKVNIQPMSDSISDPTVTVATHSSRAFVK